MMMLLDRDSNVQEEKLSRLKRTGHVAVKHDKYMIVWGGYMDHVSSAHEVDRYLPTSEIFLYDRLVEKWSVYITCDCGRGPIIPIANLRTLPGLVSVHPFVFHAVRTFLRTKEDGKPNGTSGACGLVHEDKLYIFGGFHAGSDDSERHTDEIFCLDLLQLTWQNFRCEGQRPVACDKMVGWVHNDRLYYFGGYGLPPKNHWAALPQRSRCQFCYDVMPGGVFNDRGWNNQLVVFDPHTQRWKWPEFKGPPPIPRAAHAAAKVGSRVYVFGGRNLRVRMNDLHCLDLDTMTWSGRLDMKGAVPDGRSWHSLTPVSDRYLVLYGGFSQVQEVFSDCRLLDLETLTWIHVPLPFQKPRLWHSACLGDAGEVLIYGGCTGNILNPQIPKQTEDIITLWFAPQSLFRLCLGAILENRHLLEQSWTQLPQSLQEILWLKGADGKNA